jgi:hypothetical protein
MTPHQLTIYSLTAAIEKSKLLVGLIEEDIGCGNWAPAVSREVTTSLNKVDRALAELGWNRRD